MRIPIDGVGRLVVPKALRDELGISGPTEVELTAVDGRLELSVPDVPAHVEEHDGVPVIVPDAPLRPISTQDVRAAIERTRR